MKNLGKAIKMFRSNSGLSIRNLAKLCELSDKTIQKCEKDSPDITIKTLVSIAKGLNTSVLEIVFMADMLDKLENGDKSMKLSKGNRKLYKAASDAIALFGK